MPNPTPQQSGGVSSINTPQTSTVIQNNISDTSSVVRQNNAQQKIAEILSNISARLDNVTNLRTQTQSAVYDTFGNNFITRGATQITDSVFDSVEGMFSKKEAPVEDKVLRELKKHTEALTALLSAKPTDTGPGGTDDTKFAELIELNSRALEVHELILARLDKIGLENHEYYNESITFLEDQKKLSEKNLEMLHNALTHITNHGNQAATDSGKIKFKEAKQQPTHTIDKNVVVIDHNTIDVDLPLDETIEKAPTVNTPNTDEVTDVTDNNLSEDVKDKKEISLLTSMSNTLLDMSKHIKRFFADQPLSTQEKELESGRVGSPNKDNTINKKTGEIESDTSFFGKVSSAIIGGLTALIEFFSGNKMKLFLDVFGKSIFTIIGGLTSLLSFFGGKIVKTILDSIGKLKDILPGSSPSIPNTPIPEGPSKTPPVPSGPVPEGPSKTPTPSKTPPVPSGPKTPPVPKTGGLGDKIAKTISKILPLATKAAGSIATKAATLATFAGPVAAVAGAGITGWDIGTYLNEKMEGTSIGKAKDDMFDTIFSGIDRIVGNNIQKETDYLDDKLNGIEEKQREIDKEMKARMSTTSQATPVQTSPTVVNNSTVMPIRESVKNTDDSFNRYLASVLG